MSEGQISELLVELAGLDVAHALGVVIGGDKPIAIRCALLDLQGENGQMAVQTLVFDTANSIISGEGTIDLRDEKVNIVVIPAPKRFSPPRDLGQGKDADCDALIASVQKQDPQRLVLKDVQKPGVAATSTK